ncbi:hypothetical protein GCM10027199_68340 [Amycolatopsis magusensis]
MNPTLGHPSSTLRHANPTFRHPNRAFRYANLTFRQLKPASAPPSLTFREASRARSKEPASRKAREQAERAHHRRPDHEP